MTAPPTLDRLTARAPAAMEILAGEEIAKSVPDAYAAAADSIARQAAGGWTAEELQGEGFRVRTYDRTIALSQGFGAQAQSIIEGLRGSRIPDLIAIVAKLGDDDILDAFLAFFAAHELLHVEQGLGSDQFEDSDHYMPAVMEADYVTDISGLVVCLHAPIPGLSALAPRERALLLIAIHLFSMHSFVPAGGGVSTYTFTRLSIWYLHFARIHKAQALPDLARPGFARSWVVMFPKLVSDRDETVTAELLSERERAPRAAAPDIVMAFHRDDGLYRLRRAVLTDRARAGRLCAAIVDARFDDVRAELEEPLVDNPWLSADGEDRAGAELASWTSDAFAALQNAGDAVRLKDSAAFEAALDGLRIAIARLPSALSRSGRGSRRAMEDLAKIDAALDEMDGRERDGEGWVKLRSDVRRLYLPLGMLDRGPE